MTNVDWYNLVNLYLTVSLALKSPLYLLLTFTWTYSSFQQKVIPSWATVQPKAESALFGFCREVKHWCSSLSKGCISLPSALILLEIFWALWAFYFFMGFHFFKKYCCNNCYSFIFSKFGQGMPKFLSFNLESINAWRSEMSDSLILYQLLEPFCFTSTEKFNTITEENVLTSIYPCVYVHSPCLVWDLHICIIMPGFKLVFLDMYKSYYPPCSRSSYITLQRKCTWSLLSFFGSSWIYFCCFVG